MKCEAKSARLAVAAAEEALAKESDPEASDRVLACILHAVKLLEAERLDAQRGESKSPSRMLRVPRNP